MNTKKSQRGITLLGFVILLAVVGFFMLMAAKLFPAYTEFNSVKKAMDAMKSEPNAVNFTKEQAWSSMEKKFYISYVETPTRLCLTIDRKAGASATCKYEYRKAFVYNIDFLVTFEYTVKLGG